MRSYSYLNCSVKNHVATIELNRPEKANALNFELWREIGDVFRELDETNDARCVILKGAGSNFSAGIDFALVERLFKQAKSHGEGRRQESMQRFIRQLQDDFSAVENCRKPVIAAIHGACYGAGIDLISACDMRYATDQAKLCVKEIDLAIVADIGTLQRLPTIIGQGLTRELAFTARVIDGSEAVGMGLVNRSFASEAALFENVDSIAATIATKSPLAVRGTKQILNYSRDHSVANGLEYVACWNAGMLMSEDLEVAVAAMIGKSDSVNFKD